MKTANIIFGQSWTRHSQLYDDKSDSEDENEETLENYGKIEGKVCRKKYEKDLTYVFPSNRTLDRYLEDASYLNLHMVAEYLLNKDEGILLQLVLMTQLNLLAINLLMSKRIISLLLVHLSLELP